MKALSDYEVIRRIKKGEIDYYEYIVKSYTSRIFNLISSKLFKKHDAEDLVQNTFICFYKAIDRFDETKPILPYLYEIAKNELKMYYRSYKEIVPLNEQIVGGIGQEALEHDELISILKAVTSEQRTALLMIHDGYSYKEISTKLKKPLNTVRTLIRRARLLLISKKTNEKS